MPLISKFYRAIACDLAPLMRNFDDLTERFVATPSDFEEGSLVYVWLDSNRPVTAARTKRGFETPRELIAAPDDEVSVTELSRAAIMKGGAIQQYASLFD